MIRARGNPCASSPPHACPRRGRGRDASRTERAASESIRFPEISRHGRQRDRRPRAVRDGPQMSKRHTAFPSTSSSCLATTCTAASAGRLRQEIRAAPMRRCSSAGVKFQASLGNHDRPEQVSYKPFNMNGQRYYTYARNNVRFLALDSNLMDPKQLEWIEDDLQGRARRLEDPLLPSPAVLERRAPRRVGRSARAARAALHQVRRQRRLLRSRSRLRATSSPRRASTTSSPAPAGSCGRATWRRPIRPRRRSIRIAASWLVEVAGSEMFFQAISRTGQTSIPARFAGQGSQ